MKSVVGEPVLYEIQRRPRRSATSRPPLASLHASSGRRQGLDLPARHHLKHTASNSASVQLSGCKSNAKQRALHGAADAVVYMSSYCVLKYVSCLLCMLKPYRVFTRSSKRPALACVFWIAYICRKFAGCLLDRVNTPLKTKQKHI